MSSNYITSLDILPKWNASSALLERNEKRKSLWEKGFFANHQKFADEFAYGIAQEIFEKLKTNLEDHYKKTPNKKNVLESTYSLNVIESSSALQMKKLTPEAAKLPPFSEWFDKFSIESEHDKDYSGKGSTTRRHSRTMSVDSDYFQSMFSLVASLAKPRLESLFEDFKKRQGNEGIRFNVHWIKNDSGSDKITVGVWIETKSQPGHTEELGAANQLIEQKLVERKRNQLINSMLRISLCVGVCFVLIYLLTSSIVNKQTAHNPS